jgi:hypothetical protein
LRQCRRIVKQQHRADKRFQRAAFCPAQWRMQLAVDEMRKTGTEFQ